VARLCFSRVFEGSEERLGLMNCEEDFVSELINPCYTSTGYTANAVRGADVSNLSQLYLGCVIPTGAGLPAKRLKSGCSRSFRGWLTAGCGYNCVGVTEWMDVLDDLRISRAGGPGRVELTGLGLRPWNVGMILLICVYPVPVIDILPGWLACFLVMLICMGSPTIHCLLALYCCRFLVRNSMDY